MQLLGIVAFELIVIFFLSRHLLRVMYTLLLIILRSKTVVIGLVTIMYLPGTVIHELAHLIVAEVLRVKTGEISFTPIVEKLEDGSTEVHTGHVKIAESDPIRRYLIGLAPLPFGLFFLFLCVWIFNYFFPQLTDWKLQAGLVALIGYLLFAISNNMFSSRVDLEGFIFLVPIFLLLAASAYIAGFRLTLTGQIQILSQQILTSLATALAIVIGVNLVILLINGVLLRGILKLSRRTFS